MQAASKLPQSSVMSLSDRSICNLCAAGNSLGCCSWFCDRHWQTEVLCDGALELTAAPFSCLYSRILGFQRQLWSLHSSEMCYYCWETIHIKVSWCELSFFKLLFRFFFLFSEAASSPANQWARKHKKSRLRQREKQLHLVLNVWSSGLGWAWRSIRCDGCNLSHLKGSCGDCCHVPTLEWNSVPEGAALHPDAFVTLWACLRHPSLDTCTVPCGLLCHIAVQRSLWPPAPQFEQTYAISETAKWRQRLTDRDRRMKGYRKGAGFFGRKCFRLWLGEMEKNGSNMKDLRNKRWRQSNTNREAFERRGAGHVRGGFHVPWGRSWWEKQSRMQWAAGQTVFTVETASRHSHLSLSQQCLSLLIIAVFLFEDDLSGFVAVMRNFCFV